MKNFSSLIVIVFTLFLFTFNAEAGTILVSSQQSQNHPEDTSVSKAYIDKNRMRAESKEHNGDVTIIFLNDKQVFWSIDNRKRTYTEFTKKDVIQMKTQMDEAMKQFQEQMKNMPQEQRAMMEQMMKGKMPSQSPKTTFRKTASNIKINKWTCDKYEGYLEGIKTKEIWTTDWRNLGLSREDFNVMQGMSEFFEELTQNKSLFFKAGSKDWEKEQGYPGIPVKTVSYSNGQIKHINELKQIRKQDLDPSLFELPEGFTKKNIQGQ